jgi:hypothetical protein
MMAVSGPRGEQIALGMSRLAIDPTNRRQAGLPRAPGVLVHSFRGDLVKAYPDLFQAWRRAIGKPPAKLQVDKITPMPAQGGGHCAFAEGHLDPDGKGMQTFRDYMCVSAPMPNGAYTVMLNHATAPDAVAERERGTMQAIVASWKVDQAVLNRQAAAASQRMAADTQARIQQNQRAVARIQQIGEQATLRMKNVQEANDAQHAGWSAQQDANTRRTQGFSNYLLDQTVVQDNAMHGTGTVGHGTAWNSTADALVKADPRRFEIVDTPGYWRGVDY